MQFKEKLIDKLGNNFWKQVKIIIISKRLSKNTSRIQEIKNVNKISLKIKITKIIKITMAIKKIKITFTMDQPVMIKLI